MSLQTTRRGAEFGSRSRDLASRPVRRRWLHWEPLEDRRLLSNIVWENDGANGGDSDQFNAAFGSNATLARAIVRQAIQDWEQVITNFNFDLPGLPANELNTFGFNIQAMNLGNQLTQLDPNATIYDRFGNDVENMPPGGPNNTLQFGKPVTASVYIDTNGGGYGWYFDPSPATNGEFPQFINPFSARGNIGNHQDFYTTVLHAIGDAIGITLYSTLVYDRSTELGPDPVDPPEYGYERSLFGVPYFDPATGAMGQTVFTNSGDAGLYWGERTSDIPASDPIFPYDLMNVVQLPNTRELISDIDVELLQGLYANNQPPFPSETVVYPTSLGLTFLTNLDPVTHTLTITADPRIANNDIELSAAGGNLLVDVNGVTTRYQASAIQSVVINGGPGSDTIRLPGDPLRFAVSVNGGGQDKLSFVQDPSTVSYIVNSGSVTLSTRTLVFGVYRTFQSSVRYQGLSELDIVGSPGDTATVIATAAPTSVTLFGMKAVVVGSSGMVNQIEGAVNVLGFGFGSTDLTIDDSADRAAVSPTITASAVTGLAPAPINYNGPDLHSLTIKGGQAANRYTIAGTPRNTGRDLAMTLDTGDLADWVTVMGTSGDLTVDEGKGANILYADMANLTGTLTAHSTGGSLSLVADDHTDNTARSVTMGVNLIPISTVEATPAAVPKLGRIPRKKRRPNPIKRTTHFYAQGFVDGLGPGQVLYDAASMAGVSVETGEASPAGNSPGNTVTVEQTFFSSSANKKTWIAMGGHNDVTNVEATSGPLSISGAAGAGDSVNIGTSNEQLSLIRGPLAVSKSVLDVENQNGAGKESVVVGATSLTVNGAVAVSYSGLSGLSYQGNAGNNSYSVLASPGGNLQLNAGSGNDTLTVGSPSIALDGFGSVSLDGAGGRDSLVIYDGSATAGLNYDVHTLTSHGPAQTVVQRTGSVSIAINRIAKVALNIGSGGDTVNLQSVAPGTALAVHGGAGNDRFSVQGLSPNAPVSIDGGGGTNTLDYSSYSSSGGQSTTPPTLPSGIVAWYKAEGNTNDSIGGNAATPVDQGPAYVPGEVGQAFQFDGGGYLSVPDAPGLDTPTVTVEAWVKSSQIGENPYSSIVCKGADGVAFGSYWLTSGPNGGLIFRISDGVSVADSPDAGAGVWDGKWHHVAGTYDGSTVRLYVDGKQVGNGTPATLQIDYNLPSSNDLAIGEVGGGGDFHNGFSGAIDELSIYNRALSPPEIQAIYNAGSAGKSAAPGPSTQGVIVDLPMGTATSLADGISHIQNLVGSPGDDILVGNGGNTINGLGGDDLLIAGASASTLTGTGADIVIGGQTALDGNLAALEAVLAAWTSPDASFADRVSALVGGLLASGKVKSNKQRNNLAGGGGPNLFFASAIDTTNVSSGDSSVPI